MLTEIRGARDRPPPEKRRPHPTEDRSGLENGARRDDLNAASRTTQLGRVVPFPRRHTPRAICVGCGNEFVPRASWHKLCPTCHAGAAAYLAIRRARRLLAGLGR